MKKVTIVYGTRPEFIKLIPLIKLLEKEKDIKVQTISTGQHSDLLDMAHLDENYIPNHCLEVKRKFGDLNELIFEISKKLHIFSQSDKRPDLILVHGDTASSFASALFAFQTKVPIAHIEAGLRSKNLNSPFPEEFYRQSISKMASINFAPTKQEYLNLINEGISSDDIHIVGNTILDAIKSKVEPNYSTSKLILISIHRRESKAQHKSYLNCIDQIAMNHKDFQFEFTSHPSNNEFSQSDFENIEFIKPLSHKEFLNKLNNSCLFISDSGGGQEEASFLGVPTFIMRDVSERMDGLNQKTKLIGNSVVILAKELSEFLLFPITKRITIKNTYRSPANMIKNIVVDSLIERKDEEISFSKAT